VWQRKPTYLVIAKKQKEREGWVQCLLKGMLPMISSFHEACLSRLQFLAAVPWAEDQGVST
jgi:hypothetical protein